MSNNVYSPDKWVVIEIKTPEQTHYKVLGSWYGGFADGDSWRASSGITEVKKTDKGYEFKNHSGSTYKCHRDGYGMSLYTQSIFTSWQATDKASIRVIPEAEMENFQRYLDGDAPRSATMYV